MRPILFVIALLFAGCAKESIKGIDGREYVRVTEAGKPVAGIPATEALYQVSGATGSGKPAYIRSLGSRDSFTRVGDLP